MTVKLIGDEVVANRAPGLSAHRRIGATWPLNLSLFLDQNFKPVGACSAYSVASLFLLGHLIPAPFFNEFSSLPGI